MSVSLIGVVVPAQPVERRRLLLGGERQRKRLAARYVIEDVVGKFLPEQYADEFSYNCLDEHGYLSAGRPNWRLGLSEHGRADDRAIRRTYERQPGGYII